MLDNEPGVAAARRTTFKGGVRMKGIRPSTVVLTALLLAGCGSTSAEAPPPAAPNQATSPAAAAPRSLYDRLGGQPAIEAVVGEFIARVAADKRINGRFINTDIARLKGLLVEFVCAATGGPCKYEGRDMHVAHAGFQIVDAEFDALVEDLAGALAKFNVPKAEQNDLLGALGPLKPQIVNPPPAAAAHDPKLAEAAGKMVAELRQSGAAQPADLLELAVTARTRGQRSYAEILYSAAERQLPDGKLTSLNPLFREGAPERITTALKTLPQDTPAQPKTAVGGSDEDNPEAKPLRGSLVGTMHIEGGPDQLGIIALDPVGGRRNRRKPKQRIMEQRDRQFAPRLLAIPAGSTVSFPNFDPVYHNVFSLSPARAFDLGIYKNGESRDVTFEKEGIIRLGCNLHANMTAHVAVVAAPHYVVSEPGGHYKFRSLAPGKYKLRAWAEDSTEPVQKTIEIKEGENTLDLEVPRGAPAGLGTDKFGLSRGKAP
jgi:hemoglobin